MSFEYIDKNSLPEDFVKDMAIEVVALHAANEENENGHPIAQGRVIWQVLENHGYEKGSMAWAKAAEAIAQVLDAEAKLNEEDPSLKVTDEMRKRAAWEEDLRIAKQKELGTEDLS